MAAAKSLVKIVKGKSLTGRMAGRYWLSSSHSSFYSTQKYLILLSHKNTLMKAVAVNEFKALPQVMDLPEPTVKEGSIKIKLTAAGLNPPFDWKMIEW